MAQQVWVVTTTVNENYMQVFENPEEAAHNVIDILILEEAISTGEQEQVAAHHACMRSLMARGHAYWGINDALSVYCQRRTVHDEGIDLEDLAELLEE